MSKEYWQLLKDPRWQKKRLEVMERDGFKCLDCGDSGNTLHVHHCLYRRNRSPWEYEMAELRTLCEACHQLRADIEHDVKLEFARLLALLSQDQVAELMPQIINAEDGGVYSGGLADGIVIMTTADYIRLKHQQAVVAEAAP